MPSGWLADRIPPIFLILAGLAATGIAVLVLTLPPTTPLLMVAGTLTGLGGGLVITPMLVEISRRSRDADRGSAFALFSAANAGALAIGSIGGAIVLERFGFEGAMLATLAGTHRGRPPRPSGPRAARPTDADRAGIRPVSRTRALERSELRAPLGLEHRPVRLHDARQEIVADLLGRIPSTQSLALRSRSIRSTAHSYAPIQSSPLTSTIDP